MGCQVVAGVVVAARVPLRGIPGVRGACQVHYRGLEQSGPPDMSSVHAEVPLPALPVTHC